MSERGFRSFARMAKYNPAGPAPTQTILTFRPIKIGDYAHHRRRQRLLIGLRPWRRTAIITRWRGPRRALTSRWDNSRLLSVRTSAKVNAWRRSYKRLM